jgi:hypothetical protein
MDRIKQARGRKIRTCLTLPTPKRCAEGYVLQVVAGLGLRNVGDTVDTVATGVDSIREYLGEAVVDILVGDLAAYHLGETVGVVVSVGLLAVNKK